MRDHVVAVDVGTGSARAGIFDLAGRLKARREHPILMHRPCADHAEHDSEDIWAAVCHAVRAAREAAEIEPAQIGAIGFDATCSLVVRDRDGRPLSVSTKGEASLDTVVWLDHRATAEADRCTASRHPVMDYSGQFMSPEMQMPKLMWLKANLPQIWERAGYIFDLADFLSWRASGSHARSRCTLTPKWNYLGHVAPGWQSDFLQAIGLDDLLQRGGLPETAVAVGAGVGQLTSQAAADLGLETQTRVSAGMVDAYAGALGVLGAFADDPERMERQLALIAGTSSCLVSLSTDAKPTRGLWGPYFDALLPGYWLVEGGQSAAGALLDHVVRMHAAGGPPTPELHARIIVRARELRAIHGASLGERIHILPDFHGNRSPAADPHALGVISGLTLDTSFDGLCTLYWRACVAIALGIRHVLEVMRDYGYGIDRLHVTGGHLKNPLMMELYPDVTGCTIIVPDMPDSVLLGTAMGAAVAGGLHPDLAAAGRAMTPTGQERRPNPDVRSGYDRDYRRFLAMLRHRAELDTMA